MHHTQRTRNAFLVPPAPERNVDLNGQPQCVLKCNNSAPAFPNPLTPSLRPSQTQLPRQSRGTYQTLRVGGADCITSKGDSDTFTITSVVRQVSCYKTTMTPAAGLPPAVLSLRPTCSYPPSMRFYLAPHL